MQGVRCVCFYSLKVFTALFLVDVESSSSFKSKNPISVDAHSYCEVTYFVPPNTSG